MVSHSGPKQYPGAKSLLQDAQRPLAALPPPTCPRTCPPHNNMTLYRTTCPSATRASVGIAWPFNPCCDPEFSNGVPYPTRHTVLKPARRIPLCDRHTVQNLTYKLLCRRFTISEPPSFASQRVSQEILNKFPNVVLDHRKDNKEPKPLDRGLCVCDRLLVHAGMGSLPNLSHSLLRAAFYITCAGVLRAAFFLYMCRGPTGLFPGVGQRSSRIQTRISALDAVLTYLQPVPGYFDSAAGLANQQVLNALGVTAFFHKPF